MVVEEPRRGPTLPVYAGNEKIFADVPPSHPVLQTDHDRLYRRHHERELRSDGRLYFRPGFGQPNHVAKMTANLLGHLNKGTRTASSPSGRDPHDKPAG